MTREIDEDDIFIRKSAIELTCGCARATCGPHRCGPSRIAWGLMSFLLVWILILLSYRSVGLEQQLEQRLANLTTELQATFHAQLLQEMRHPLRLLQDRQDLLVSLQRDRATLDQLLWLTQTPDAQKYLELKAAITAIQSAATPPMPVLTPIELDDE